MELSIDAAGVITAIHDDALVELYDHGQVHIVRASEVEPIAGGRWLANMRDGTVLGPYRTRGAALAAEVEYLKARLF